MHESPDAPRVSNAEIAAASLARLGEFLMVCARPSMRNGAINLSALARDAGVDRQFLYANEHAAELLKECARKKGWTLPAPRPTGCDEPVGLDVVFRDSASVVDLERAERRIKSLEEQLALGRAENQALRSHLARLRHIDDLLAENGRLPR